jgi:Ser-tRNA(Ala) deacylase AlaX
MDVKLTYFSDVKEGKLQTNVRQRIANELQCFEGKRVEITIHRLRSKRSSQQNKYLHVLFTIFKDALNDLGNEFTMQQVKDLCKRKFLSFDLVDKSTGEVIGEDIRHTSSLNKTEFNEFIESIIRWAASFFNIVLPYPSESIEINFDR